MKINSSHNSYIDFIRNEIKTLQHFRSQPTINSNIPELAAMSNRIFDTYHYANDDILQKSGFEFNCETKLPIQGYEKIVLIEGFVKPNFSDLSYQFAICHPEGSEDIETGEVVTDENRLIRKFHFDYAANGYTQTVKKPIYHLQHGGSQNIGLRSINVSAGPHKWIEVPRFQYIPINLALMMDLVFSEFPSVATQKARDNDQWRSLMKKNEEFILKPYYDNLSAFLASDQHSANKLLRDFYYGA